jgi:hypothetical protein
MLNITYAELHIKALYAECHNDECRWGLTIAEARKN